MNVGKRLLVGLIAAALAAPAGATAASPAWDIQSLAAPTNFAPGDESGLDSYEVFITNSGGEQTNRGPITITDTLPAGLKVKDVNLYPPHGRATPLPSEACKTNTVGGVVTVSCEVEEALSPKFEPARLEPGEALCLRITVATPATVSGPLVNRVAVGGGGASPSAGEGENRASAEAAKAGFEEFHADLTDVNGQPASAADSRPYQFTTSFAVNTVPAPPGSSSTFVPAEGDLKEIEVALPPGLTANPNAAKRCSAKAFNTTHNEVSKLGGNASINECPDESAVGMAFLQQVEGENFFAEEPIYNLVPPAGMPVQLGFQIAGLPNYINTRLRSDGDYGATAYVHNVTEAERITAARVTIWGAPGVESHDTLRGKCVELEGSCPVEEEKPLLRLPSSCANPLLSTMSFVTWARPATGASASAPVPAPVPGECAVPDFSPTIAARPTTNVADAPSGLHFELSLPQKEHEEGPEEVGEADLREAVVRLPRGLAVNPASADGLAACTPAQVGLATVPGQSPIHFNTAPSQCPDAAKVGTVSVIAPAVDHPISGSVFLASQEDNPFNSLLALYIVLEDPESGIVIKLAAKVSPDSVTGQLTTTVEEVPQQPFEKFSFDFFEGARAPLRTPAACGTYEAKSLMTPWTAPTGASAEPADPFEVSAGPAGPCPSGALAPKLSAGLANPTAGSYSPFSLRLTRPDASDEFAAITAAPPTGVVAKLAGVPYCPEAGIAQAISRSHPGQGAVEANQASCPAASQIGSAAAGAGAGPSPIFTTGKVYLAGPYKGAPLSMVAIVPALAGPFDLGAVVNRIALHLDPETTQVSAQSDPLPLILSGIPLDVRDIRVNLDRPGFTLAPTSCAVKAVTANVQGASGSTASVSDRFQALGCKNLRFKPGLSLKLSGGTKRSAHPALRAAVSYPKGNYANTATASVALPHSEFLDQAHIRTICTRVQFAAKACPKGSIYGKARAFSPLLDKPVEGPVYLRSSSNPLPDLVLALHGQIDAVAVGRIDSHNGGIRTTFDAVPDVPLSKVVLEMRGGKKGLLVNSRNICKHTNRATARFGGQNGKTYDFRPVLKDACRA